ncbi:MAG: histidinol-phosphate transaminase [Rikenellaceae bacterium]|jgi:histidinol-phosphate aminotransferase|nr:histidinol-phosphate transaminase [Rikenellaceae bacterium]
MKTEPTAGLVPATGRLVSELVRENIRALSPYSTARDEYVGELGVFLDANENPYDNGLNRYPDPYQRQLKRRLAEIRGAAVENIFVGNGSDEVIDLAFRVFCTPGVDCALSVAPTYGMYRVAAATNDVRMVEVQLGENFELDTDRLLAAAPEAKLLFICSPNNPSGNSFPHEQLRRLLSSFGGMVVLDEAYIDFSSRASFLAELDRWPNLVILQTLSKAWGMAGLRLGLAFASSYVTGLFTRVKYPYNINALAQRTALERLATDVAPQVREIVSERRRLAEALAQLPVVKHVYPSDANFLLVRFDDPREIYRRLIGAGLIVRDRSSIPGCEGCLRITVGTPEENGKLLEEL